MKISAKAEYACLALLALAQHGRDSSPLRIREISELQRIPERYLVQILLQLKAAGLVVSLRGASGGYRLARPAGEITLSEVLAAIDGPDWSLPERPEANRPGSQLLATVWDRVRAAERCVLEGTSIGELAAQSTPHEWTI
jgi:Rrf2 family transcriptional regulator, cysteine metabolism repressor